MGYVKMFIIKMFKHSIFAKAFLCFHSKKQFTEEEISSIIYNILYESYFQRTGMGIIESKNMHKEYEPTIINQNNWIKWR